MKKIIISSLLLLSTSVFAQEVNGTWLRDSGLSRVKFADCGGSICGTVVWTKTPIKDDKNPEESLRSRSIVGVQVFYAMKAEGTNSWVGKAYNPDDGKVYTGKMALDGNKLTTKGCAMGGLICKSAGWSRAN